jgi:type I restriction enzyme R subunit
MARWFTLFISGRRYIARYHQYFAVHAVLARVSKPELDGRRPGGVIMHTQGSGKTLTMVMLSQVLLDVFRERAPRVLLVTDRTEADDNLHDVLLSSGVECRRATTGRELRNLLQDRRARAITTVIHKFHAAVNAPTLIADSPDIFVLIDEAHRTQTGRLHYAMRQMLPRACFIAFTGTPLDTRAHDIFGEYLSTYRWDDAVQDNVVVPMRWELRNHVMKDVSEAQWWPLADTADDPTPFDHEHDTTIAAFLEAPSRVHAIATDVAQHFNQHFAGSNLKGQLIASSRTAALLFKKFLDAIGTVTSEVAISLDGSAPDLLHYEEFRRQVLAKYGTEAKYQADLVRRFAEADDPKILISVERLITGLDVPRCSVMYIARPLRGPTLLQAIARANRRHEGKTHGLIVDYLDLSREIRDAVSLGLDLKAAEPATAQTAPPLAPKSLLDQQSRDQPAGIFSALKESCLNILHEELDESGSNVTATSVDALAQRIAETILIRRKVDWIEDLDLQNQMKIFIEDELFEMQSNEGIVLDLRRIDAILDRCIASARQISA